VNELALDFKGRFLFVGTSMNNMEMYTIDANTGALQEVPNSPFASPTTSPQFLFTESSGQFLYVIDFTSASSPNNSLVESFQIDPVNLDLIPTPASATALPGIASGAACHPSGKAFYVFVNDPTVQPNQPHFLFFDSSNGAFAQPNVLPSNSTDAMSLALDPSGRFLALATANQLTIQDLLSDGTLGSKNLSAGVFSTPPSDLGSMIFDALGQFLYVSFPSTPSVGAGVYSYSPLTLVEFPNSPLPANFPSTTSWIVDPTAPLIMRTRLTKSIRKLGCLILSFRRVPFPIPPSTHRRSLACRLARNPLLAPSLFSVPFHFRSGA
jgi:hypothetical protein